MTKKEVIAWMEENRDERGMENWDRLGESGDGKMTSYGIGLTRLRKFAKQVGKSHELAAELWKVANHEVKIVALLIDEPKKITREQVEDQVEGVGPGSLSHVFSSCDAPLAKAPFAGELAGDWMDSEDPVRRSCAYGLIYELSKTTKKSAPDDTFYSACMKRIKKDIKGEENWVKGSMLGALFGIGKRNKEMNAAALKVIRSVGKVEVDYGNTTCEPLDVEKHLTSDYLKKKLGI